MFDIPNLIDLSFIFIDIDVYGYQFPHLKSKYCKLLRLPENT